MSIELIAPTTDAGPSIAIGVRSDKLPYTISAAPPLAGGEVATLEYKGSDGIYYPLLEGGTAIGLSSSDSIVSIFTPMQIRVVKSATAGATGIYGAYEDSI